MFYQAICLTHYSEDFIQKLQILGYEESPYFKGSSKNTRDDVCICTSVIRYDPDPDIPSYVIVDKQEALSMDPRISWVNETAQRYITDNEDLAFALASLQKSDSDKNQYFTLDCNLAALDDVDKIKPKGELVFCTRDKWFVDYDNDGNPWEFSNRNVPAHKSTKDEILEFFNKKEK